MFTGELSTVKRWKAQIEWVNKKTIRFVQKFWAFFMHFVMRFIFDKAEY